MLIHHTAGKLMQVALFPQTVNLLNYQNSQVQVLDRIYCSLENVTFKSVAYGYGSTSYNNQLKKEVAVVATLLLQTQLKLRLS